MCECAQRHIHPQSVALSTDDALVNRRFHLRSSDHGATSRSRRCVVCICVYVCRMTHINPRITDRRKELVDSSSSSQLQQPPPQQKRQQERKQKDPELVISEDSGNDDAGGATTIKSNTNNRKRGEQTKDSARTETAAKERTSTLYTSTKGKNTDNWSFGSDDPQLKDVFDRHNLTKPIKTVEVNVFKCMHSTESKQPYMSTACRVAGNIMLF